MSRGGRLNILVCVKQVPDTEKIRIDEKTNTLVRDGVESVINPFDTYALEAAARIKDENPGSRVVAVSMGLAQAENSLRECLAAAADEAYLVNDRSFGGSDTFATSYILSEAAKVIEEREGKFDAVFCGRQAVDGDTAQVGPELAERLGIPQVTNVLSLEYVPDGNEGRMRAVQERQDGKRIIEIKCPCLITFTKSDQRLRTASLKAKLAARKKTVHVISKEDIKEIDEKLTGLNGSPTRVKRTFVPARDKENVSIRLKDPGEAAKELLRLLRERNGIVL